MTVDSKQRLILLTGVTGYVGGRLAPALIQRGYGVRCLVRDPDRAAAAVPDGASAVKGDVLDLESLRNAMQDVDTAFFLVHSMGAGRDFEELDRRAAFNFAEAARSAGLRRIIYLGGLGEGRTRLSAHLRSRQEVGAILAGAGLPVIELRASIVIGSGSLSFEMIRALVERLPVMITPRWVSVKAQPIGITDLLEYLLQSVELETAGSRIFEIGATDRMSYGDLMREYARQRGLRRFMISVPVLTPRLSSLWLGLVTPLYARVGRKLAESLRHPTVVGNDEAMQAFSIRTQSISEAISEALRKEEQEFVVTRWSDSVSASGAPRTWAGVRFGNRLVDSRETFSTATPDAAFSVIRRIGGRNGWYYADWLWRIRGFMDLLVGGIGIRRGRRHPELLAKGDVLDWWRVEEVEEERSLKLAAEARLPGRAWLVYDVTPVNAGCMIRQTAIFDPVGLSGLLYWYSVYPLHAMVFRGMLKGIAEAAQSFQGRPLVKTPGSDPGHDPHDQAGPA